MATAVASSTDNLDTQSKICPVCREMVKDEYMQTEKHFYHNECYVYVQVSIII